MTKITLPREGVVDMTDIIHVPLTLSITPHCVALNWSHPISNEEIVLPIWISPEQLARNQLAGLSPEERKKSNTSSARSVTERAKSKRPAQMASLLNQSLL
jgi:hypothetical protein